MRPDDLALLRTPGTPAVAPDGRIAVVAVTRPDMAADRYRSQLWAVPTDASAPARPLTSGGRDTDPAFSPDGRWLAYLGAADDGPPQVHLLPTAGGAPRRLTGLPLGAGAPVWSPDSRRLAWTGPAGDAPDPGAPVLVTTLRHLLDGAGLPGGPRRQVHVLDLPDDLADDGEPVPEPGVVTTGDADCADVCWRPDGGELAFVSARHATADRDLRTDVFAVHPDGSGLRRVTASPARCSRPAWSPDGAVLLVTVEPEPGPGGADDGGRARTLCRVPAGGGELEPVPDLAGDMVPGALGTERGALVRVRRDGAVGLLRVPPEGGTPEVLVDGPFTVRGVGAGGGVVVATVGHDASTGELIAITPGRRRLLTSFGRALAATGRVHRVRERSAAAPDGAPVHGWVTVPDGPGPHPVVLRVSGGPSAQDGWALLDDVQAAVTAGCAVLQCGVRDPADGVLALLDAALADPELRLDAGRVALTGGAAAALLLAPTGRFAAAVVEEASEPGTSPGPDLAALGEAIPTPTLVLAAGDGSHRGTGPVQPLYVALKRRGVPAELLLFPGEGGPGRPRHRVARLEHLVRWWQRWLTAG